MSLHSWVSFEESVRACVCVQANMCERVILYACQYPGSRASAIINIHKDKFRANSVRYCQATFLSICSFRFISHSLYPLLLASVKPCELNSSGM